MRRLFPAILFSVAALFALSVGTLAQDGGPSLDQRREAIRRLPQDERERLKAALQRFRSLSPEKQAELRAKAERIGAERLQNLAGRDVSKLRDSHDKFRAELDRIFEALGEDRLAGLSPEERTFMRAEALRGFQRHIKRRVMGFASIEMMERDWEALSPVERKERMESGWRKIEEGALAQMPAAESDRIRALKGPERREARERIFHEFRLAEALEFSKQFDGQRLRPFKAWGPGQREKALSRWKATQLWYDAAKRLTDEVGVDAATIERMAPLPASDWARINFEIRITDDMPADRRRVHLTEFVNRLAGQRAASPPEFRSQAPALPQVLRHRFDRRGAPK